MPPIPVELLGDASPQPALRLEPLHDMVVFRVEDATRTAAGLYVPDNVDERKRCIVVSVGPGRFFDDGTRQEPTVQVGNQILISPHAQRPYGIDVAGEPLWLCRESDIVARFVPAEPVS